jgi:hypothetical protein
MGEYSLQLLFEEILGRKKETLRHFLSLTW